MDEDYGACVPPAAAPVTDLLLLCLKTKRALLRMPCACFARRLLFALASNKNLMYSTLNICTGELSIQEWYFIPRGSPVSEDNNINCNVLPKKALADR